MVYLQSGVDLPAPVSLSPMRAEGLTVYDPLPRVVVSHRLDRSCSVE
jgi:hypothetical protein